MNEALEKLDALMQQLVEADQTGEGIDPQRVARELGIVRQLMTQSPAVIPRPSGESHFRCESCGTITHGKAMPAACPECGHPTLFKADIQQSDSDAGPG